MGEGKLALTDRPQRAESERERAHGRGELPLTGEVRLSGGAGALGLFGQLGCFLLFFFSGFSNAFSISFSIEFSNPDSN
jgi:hypothetical protein